MTRDLNTYNIQFVSIETDNCYFPISKCGYDPLHAIERAIRDDDFTEKGRFNALVSKPFSSVIMEFTINITQ